MWIYLLTLVVIWIFRKVHAEYTKPLNVDVSKNSVPLVKNSINALGMTSGTRVQAIFILSATQIVCFFSRENLPVRSRFCKKIQKIISAKLFRDSDLQRYSCQRRRKSFKLIEAQRKRFRVQFSASFFEDWSVDQQRREMALKKANANACLSFRNT